MSDEQEPKIIVDDDWKSQVEQEKEQIEQKRQQEDVEGPQMPEASFAMIVTTFATQALAALGFMPNPATGKAEVDKPVAKHFIDSLAVLEEKTAGNLTAEESSLMNDTLHQLRMAFVAADQMGAASEPASESGKSSIELP
jgi:hypothetical protein